MLLFHHRSLRVLQNQVHPQAHPPGRRLLVHCLKLQGQNEPRRVCQYQEDGGWGETSGYITHKQSIRVRTGIPARRRPQTTVSALEAAGDPQELAKKLSS